MCVVFYCFFRISIVEGSSMDNTLANQDKLLLLTGLYTAECGDIVVVEDAATGLDHPIIKRIIAVGGQRVRFTPDAIYVDGVELEEGYVYTDDYENIFGELSQYKYSVHPSDALNDIVVEKEDGVYYEILIPEGELFLMGDHRNNSKDSRDFGTVSEDSIIGEAILRIYPFQKIGNIE